MTEDRAAGLGGRRQHTLKKGENLPINNSPLSESALLFREIRARAPVLLGKVYSGVGGNIGTSRGIEELL